jgi:catechol-2,3-dioxygenase
MRKSIFDRMIMARKSQSRVVHFQQRWRIYDNQNVNISSRATTRNHFLSHFNEYQRHPTRVTEIHIVIDRYENQNKFLIDSLQKGEGKEN